jgi:Flp pilus assembly protein TadD
VAFERARYSEAMDYARQAARLAPAAARHQVILGDSYYKLSRFEEAVKAYEKAETLAPKDSSIKERRERARSRITTP